MSKKKSKKTFPKFLTLFSSPSSCKNLIITDAGLEKINCELAVKYFSLEEIFDYWNYSIDFSEIEEEEQEKFENLISFNYFSLNEEKSLKLIQSIVSQFNWLPQEMDIVTAKAVFNSEYKWIKVITLIDRWQGEIYFDSYEQEAIELGLQLKKELGNENLVIVNDNQHAVAEVNGMPSYQWGFRKNLVDVNDEKKSFKILWSPRKFVRKAHILTIDKATKVFHPDEIWWDED